MRVLHGLWRHVEQRIVGNDYKFAFAGKRYQIARADVQAGMRRRPLRLELRLDGELAARCEGRYLDVASCGMREPDPEPAKRKTTTPEEGATGCRVFSIFRALRYGWRSNENHLVRRAAPDDLRVV